MIVRVVFVGAVEFSRHCLEAVLENHGDVVAVITIAKKQSGIHSDYADFSGLAAAHGIPVYEVEDINRTDNVELIESLCPDVIFVFGWSRLISREILDIPPLGCIGVHPALLPRNRGRHPIVWALVEGLEESGLTFFYLEDRADSGDILWQKAFPISLQDDAQSVYEKIKSLASGAIKEFLPQLEAGNTPRIPQDDSLATYWRKRTQKDGEIRWGAPAMTIYNLIRGLTRPYVGAHTYTEGQVIKVWKAKLPPSPPPLQAAALGSGIVLGVYQDSFDVTTGDGYLTVCDYEVAPPVAIRDGSRLGKRS